MIKPELAATTTSTSMNWPTSGSITNGLVNNSKINLRNLNRHLSNVLSRIAPLRLKKKTIETMWVEELNELEEQYKKYQVARNKRVYGKVTKKKAKKIKKKNK